MKPRHVTKLAVLAAIVTISTTACQPTPQEESIKQKGNLEEVIQDNTKEEGESGEESVSIKDAVKAGDNSKFDLKSTNGKLEIQVDASIIIPEVSKVPVYEMVRQDYTEEDIVTLSKIFFKDKQLYKIRTLEDYTKDELLTEIEKVQEWKKQAEESNQTKDSEVKAGAADKFDSYIQTLQDLIPKAPDTVERKPITDNIFSDTGFSFLEFSGEAELEHGVGSIYIQKGDSYCAAGFYLTTPDGYEAYTRSNIIDMDGAEFADMDNTCKYSEEEAIQMTSDIIKQLGKENDYKLYSVEPVANGLPSMGKTTSYSGYQIRFSRSIDGIMETYDIYNGTDSEEEINYMPYGFERITFMVTDHGIKNFSWESPMKPGKAVAENVSLLEYQRIEDIFKNQVLIKYADIEEPTLIHVKEIRFGFMRVKNKEEDDYTLVPTWDYISDLYGESSILTINAIDGSILDRRYGY